MNNLQYKFSNNEKFEFDRTKPLSLHSAGYASNPYHFSKRITRRDFRLQIITAGRIMLKDGRTLGALEFIVYPPNVEYQYKNFAERTEYYWAHFDGTEVAQILGKCKIECGKIYRLKENNFGDIQRLFGEIFNECIFLDNFYQEMCSIKIREILIALSRTIRKNDFTYDISKNRFKNSIQHLHANLSSNIKVSELAKMESLSESRYRALFKRIFGISVVNYITNLRISHAADLLNTTTLSCAEIAGISGYDDSHYFSRVFKKETGESPGHYRKKLNVAIKNKQE